LATISSIALQNPWLQTEGKIMPGKMAAMEPRFKVFAPEPSVASLTENRYRPALNPPLR
jgi:hypothetical protein